MKMRKALSEMGQAPGKLVRASDASAALAYGSSPPFFWPFPHWDTPVAFAVDCRWKRAADPFLNVPTVPTTLFPNYEDSHVQHRNSRIPHCAGVRVRRRAFLTE